MGSAVGAREISRSQIEESTEPWGYKQRIPEGSSSRELAFLPAGLVLLCDGLGIFLAHDSTMDRVPFWSNIAVWLGIAHAAYCFVVAGWMFLGRWIWTAPQMGLTMQSILSMAYFMNIASLMGTCLYGSAPLSARMGLLVASIAWYGWWGAHALKECQAIWADESLRKRVWVRYELATVYRRSAAKEAMDKAGLRFHPTNTVIVLFLLLLIPLCWWRQELSTYFGVPFIHVLAVFFSPSVSVLGANAALVTFMLMMVYPAKLVAETGKPVLLDMITPANAPLPEAGLAKEQAVDAPCATEIGGKRLEQSGLQSLRLFSADRRTMSALRFLKPSFRMAVVMITMFVWLFGSTYDTAPEEKKFGTSMVVYGLCFLIGAFGLLSLRSRFILTFVYVDEVPTEAVKSGARWLAAYALMLAIAYAVTK